MFFDRFLSFDFYFDYMWYFREIHIEEVEKDFQKNVWRWRGRDVLTDNYEFIFELVGEKSDDGQILVNDEMFMNVYDRKTNKPVARIKHFDINTCW